MAALAIVVPAEAGPGPAVVTATPNSGLADGQTITVNATNLLEGPGKRGEGLIAQCAKINTTVGGAASNDCDNVVRTVADETGSFPTIRYAVHRTLNLRRSGDGAPYTYTCDPSCYLIAVNGGDSAGKFGYTVISFGTAMERYIDSLHLPPEAADRVKAALRPYADQLSPLFSRLLAVGGAGG